MEGTSFLSNQGYSLIPPDLIASNWERLNTHPHVASAVEFLIQDLMAGPVMFTHNDSPEAIPDSETLSQHWHEFIVLSMKHLLAWGFCAAISHLDKEMDDYERSTEYGEGVDRSTLRSESDNKELARRRDVGLQEWESGKGPGGRRKLNGRDFQKAKSEDLIVHALDLTQLDVYFRKDFLNEYNFRFFVRDNAQGGLPGHMSAFDGDDALHQREIHHVFWMIRDAPMLCRDESSRRAMIMRLDRMGDTRVVLTSPVGRLAGVMDLTEHNIACHKASSIQMSNPSVLLQDQPKTIDPNSSGSMGLNIAAHDGQAGTLEKDAQVHHTFYAKNQQLEYEESRVMTGDTHIDTIDVTISETQVVEMAAGKAVVRQNTAQPVPYILEMLQVAKEDIWQCLGVPLAVQNALNPSKKSTVIVGESAGAMHENRDSKASQSFESKQTAIRNQMMSYCQTQIDYMTLYHRTFAQKDKKRNAEPGIRILLPGLPDPIVVLDLYKAGLIKYEYLPTVIPQSYSILPSAFHAKPQLDLLQLNGIEPPQDDPSEAGKLLSSLAHPKKKKKKT